MHRLRIPLLLLIGLVLGIGLGLYIGWEAAPAEYVDANPGYLADEYQQDYVRMIAAAYAVEGDADLAQARVAGLGAEGMEVVTAVTLDAILQQQDLAEIRQLVNLAAVLGIYSPAMDPYLASPPVEATP